MINIAEITFIIPMYNARNTIIKCLLSIVNQKAIDLKNINIIIVDAGSSDSSIEIVKEFIKHHREVNINLVHGYGSLNPAQARNMGLKLAKSPYIAFIDSDIELPPNWAECCLKVLESSERVIVFGNVYPEGYLNTLTNFFRIEHKPTNSYVLSTSNFMTRLDIIKELGGFDESLKRGEDFALDDACRKKNIKVVFLRDLIAKHSGKENFAGLSKKMFISGAARFHLLLKRRSVRPISQHWQEFGAMVSLPLFLILLLTCGKLCQHFHYCIASIFILIIASSIIVSAKRFPLSNLLSFIGISIFYVYLILVFLTGFYTEMLRVIIHTFNKCLQGKFNFKHKYMS